MSNDKKQRSALSGMLEGAKKAKETKTNAGDQADSEGTTRKRFSVYADRGVFDRVKAWSTFLGVPQADIIERALTLYCDRLADERNEGQDPELPKHDGPADLP